MQPTLVEEFERFKIFRFSRQGRCQDALISCFGDDAPGLAFQVPPQLTFHYYCPPGARLMLGVLVRDQQDNLSGMLTNTIGTYGRTNAPYTGKRYWIPDRLLNKFQGRKGGDAESYEGIKLALEDARADFRERTGSRFAVPPYAKDIITIRRSRRSPYEGRGIMLSELSIALMKLGYSAFYCAFCLGSGPPWDAAANNPRVLFGSVPWERCYLTSRRGNF